MSIIIDTPFGSENYPTSTDHVLCKMDILLKEAPDPNQGMHNEKCGAFMCFEPREQ